MTVPASAVTLRLATLDDAPLLRHWDTQPHVIASDPDSDWCWETELPKNPDWRQQYIALHDERPVGYLQIMDPREDPDQYWGAVDRAVLAIDIWIGEPDALGQGIGTQMMHQALDRCFETPDIESVWIDPLLSNTEAHRFYQRLGFRVRETRWFDTDLCLVHTLGRDDWLAQRRPGDDA